MCDEWRAGKRDVNPFTGRKIVEHGRLYNKFQRKCFSICERFRASVAQNVPINPYTQRPIKYGSDMFNQMVKECGRHSSRSRSRSRSRSMS